MLRDLTGRWMAVAVLCCGAMSPAFTHAVEPTANVPAVAEEPAPNRPKVPGKLNVRLRSRVETAKGSGEFITVVRDTPWDVSKTAIIICDMWDNHYCKEAAQRVSDMAPRMNEVITAARAHGVLIIHAPSGVLGPYENTPFRTRMQHARFTKPPFPLDGWCYLDPSHEPAMPVDVSKQPCDDPVVGPAVKVFSRQHAALRITGYDGISDNGTEVYNLFVQEGIENVVLMGVHTNMCVLGRSFGIRQMVRLGFHVALCRDLTDAMYDPREAPFVSHTRGTELVVEHIEAHWCPSLKSEDLTTIIPGSADPDPTVLKRVLTQTATK